VLALVSCGGGQTAPAHPASPPAHQDAAVAADRSPSAAECDQLLDHALVLATPPDRKLTDEELAKARTQLQGTFTQQCLAMPRATYTCAMAATSMGDLAGCDQRTPSSSTSNSSVAPGGMTPAAPRSP